VWFEQILKKLLKPFVNTNEILGSMLLTIHNINFYQQLMKKSEKPIDNETFDDFHDKYINII
jgi:queuine tRNA-ribosyltransferase